MNKYFGLPAICFVLLIVFLGCSKDLSYEPNLAPTAANSATGSLKDSSGDCLPIVLKGTYYSEQATGDSDYVQITVNVTATGSYNIQTGIQNGFQFAGAGAFTNTGLQTINLFASGTPSQTGASNFSVTLDGGTCNFTVNVQDSSSSGGTTDSLTIPLNTWQFAAGGHTFSGNITNAQFSDLIGASLSLVGDMASGSNDTSFSINVEFPGTTLDTGTYVTSAAGTNFSLVLTQAGTIIYAANSTASQVLSITILSYNTTNSVVSGTFTGQAYNSSGGSVTVTNGEFKAQL